MRMSEHGRELLTEWESTRHDVYNDPAGLPTIGVGHLLTKDELTSGKILILGEAIKYGYGLTNLQIDRLLTQDLAGAEGAVNAGVTVALNQNQFDALVSFTFNIGRQAFYTSTLRKLLNEGRYARVNDQLRRWNRSGGRIVQGLINRRENEIKLFEGMI
jgi:lysozyme